MLTYMKKQLMGTGYSEIDAAEPAPPVTTFVQVPLDRHEPELAREEEMLSAVKRASEVEDVPVLQSTDPTIAAASFRGRSIPPHAPETAIWGVTQRPKDEEARRRSVLSLGSTNDAPVYEAEPVVDVTPRLSDSERRFRMTHEGVTAEDFPTVSR
jgi:hypothetical protein